MYAPNQCVFYIIYFDYPMKVFLSFLCILFYIARTPIAYQRLGSKLLLGIMFKN